MVMALLAASWWLCVRLLDWATASVPSRPTAMQTPTRSLACIRIVENPGAGATRLASSLQEQLTQAGDGVLTVVRGLAPSGVIAGPGLLEVRLSRAEQGCLADIVLLPADEPDLFAIWCGPDRMLLAADGSNLAELVAAVAMAVPVLVKPLLPRSGGLLAALDIQDALRLKDQAQLETAYAAMKEAACGPRDAWAGCALFQEAQVSLALGEAGLDVAKAYRGLEALRQLRVSPAIARRHELASALDPMEARLRLLLAILRRDPLQLAPAGEALDRAELARTLSGRPLQWAADRLTRGGIDLAHARLGNDRHAALRAARLFWKVREMVRTRQADWLSAEADAGLRAAIELTRHVANARSVAPGLPGLATRSSGHSPELAPLSAAGWQTPVRKSL